MQPTWKAISTLPRKKIEKIATAGALPVNNDLLAPCLEQAFLSPKECDRIVNLAEELVPAEATVFKGKVIDYRQSEVRWLYPSPETDWIFKRLDDLILKTNKGFKFDLYGFFSGLQVATYVEGGHYKWHMDTGMGSQSHRKLSVSIQLSPSDDYKDGDLEFIGLDQTEKQRQRSREQGTAIVFPSFLNHRVKPVSSGVRRSLVCWVSGPPFS